MSASPRVLAGLAALALLAPLAALSQGAQAAPTPDRAAAAAAPARPVIVTKASRISLTALPPIAQQGKKPAKASDKPVLAAKVKKAKPGTKVSFQKKSGSSWRTAAKATTDQAGYAVASVKPGTYRAVVGSAASKPAKAKKWKKPSFEDQFSGSSLNKSWRDQDIPPGAAGFRSCSRPDDTGRSVSGGTLNLRIALDKETPGTCTYTLAKTGATKSTPYLVNSQVVSQDSYSFTYGFAAARVKFARPRGQHSGVWIAPADSSWQSKPIEIDITEFFGDTKKKQIGIASFLHDTSVDGVVTKTGKIFTNTQKLLKDKKDKRWSSYHVVSVEWTAKGYVFRVDGKEYWRTNKSVSHAPGYMVLSTLTSDYEIPYITKANFKATTHVDWVRVWEMP